MGATWLCPNITSNKDNNITYQNNPDKLPFGSNLNFVVNHCNVTALRKNITDPNCMNDYN